MTEKQEKLFRQWLIGYFATDCGTKEIHISKMHENKCETAINARNKADEVMKTYNDIKLIK